MGIQERPFENIISMNNSLSGDPINELITLNKLERSIYSEGRKLETIILLSGMTPKDRWIYISLILDDLLYQYDSSCRKVRGMNTNTLLYKRALLLKKAIVEVMEVTSTRLKIAFENCKSRFTKKYDDAKLKAIWLHLKEENYINSNTSLDTFLYLFGNVDNVPERFYIEWLASLKELHVLIDVFWKSERNRWKKASEIFLYGDEFLKYRSLTTAVSKEDDIEDIEKKFACWLKEK